MSTDVATWAIAALATGGVILRPWKIPEVVWASVGAVALVLFGLLPVGAAVRGIEKGTDVYLFLIGMMLLSELARIEGLFDWVAAWAARRAKGSAQRLFSLVYLVGILVTVFLSNDATAVVLTPAVAAVVKRSRAEKPLPYLLICAFVANAASFVLPISNPANLVIYGSHMPPLLQWLPRYALASLAAIAATYGTLWLTQRRTLSQTISDEIAMPILSSGGKTAAVGLVATAAVLIVASGFGLQLGLPTFLSGSITTVIVLSRQRAGPWEVLHGVSWSVVVLVAGLFMLVEALALTGLIVRLSAILHNLAQQSTALAAAATGAVSALACSLMNNLPAGLIAGSAVQTTPLPPAVADSMLIGIDIGPNLSITGSLATILWLNALRREGLAVGGGAFLKLGAIIMPPALILAIGATLITR